jgi:hypothetical protein
MKQALKQHKIQDEYETPPEAVLPLVKYLKAKGFLDIWEPCDPKGTSAITKVLKKNLFHVTYTGLPKVDFLYEYTKNDCIITNPPYSKKDDFLNRAFLTEKPFAFLLPITAWEGIKRNALYKKYGLEVMVFDRRVQFVKGKSNWFATAWFCRGVLPEKLVFETLYGR